MSESVLNKLTAVSTQIGQLTVAVRHYREFEPCMWLLCLLKYGEKLTPDKSAEHEEGFKRVFSTIKEDQKYIEDNSDIKLDIPDTFEEFERHVMELPCSNNLK